MALVRCPDCGKTVSSSAEQCPGCGRPMVSVRKANAFNPFHDPVHFLGLLIVIIFIVAIVVAIVVLIINAG